MSIESLTSRTIPRLTYRPAEVAVLHGVSVRTVQRWLAARRLTSIKEGRCVLIPADEVERLGRPSAAA